MRFELADDPICDVAEWGYCYEDCTQCPAFYDCMNVYDEDEETVEEEE